MVEQQTGDALDRDVADHLDGSDPLGHFRAKFHIPDPDLAYLDGNSLGMAPAATLERLHHVVTHEWAGGLIHSWDAWLDRPRQVGDRLAPLLGAEPGEVVVHDSTTVNLYQLVHAAISLRPGRRAVVVNADEFPTDRYVVAGIASALGLEVRTEDRLDDDVAVVVRSAVDYRTAERADLDGVTRAADRVGALVVWDLSHAAGAVELDLHAAGVQLAAGCTYKFLNGGPGAPGYTYVTRDLQRSLPQPIWGWFGQVDQFAMGPEYRPLPDVRRVLLGTPGILGLAAAEEGIALVADAGMANIAAKGRALTSYALGLCDAAGLVSPTPRDPHRRGAHVAVRHSDARALTARLASRGVMVDFREPDLVRLGMSPLTTRFRDVHTGVTELAALVHEPARSRRSTPP
jgi:kynureninase